ncbi:response regulator transcription factor, partial [Bacillus sp. S34]|nr:response regulator transcription factor [Bacillus sp. S34]
RSPTATAQITAAHPQVAVLVLTTYADDESIVTALRAGARGYLTKDAGRVEIATAIRAVASGQSTFDATVGARLVAQLAGGASPAPAAPFLTVPTVKSYVNQVFTKLGVRTRAEAVALVLRS